jgi:hypothetical protein
MANFKIKKNVDVKPQTQTTSSSPDQGVNVLPKYGYIMPFAGPASKIPAGWVLCNGLNGTPDLRGRLIAGNPNVSPGSTFGSLSHSHTTTTSYANHANSGSTMGSHNHNWNSGYGGMNANHGHNWGGARGGGAGNDASANRVAGNQANVLQNGHIHNANSIGATFTRADGQSNSHFHNLNSTTFGVSASAVNNVNADQGLHNHTLSTTTRTITSSVTVNPIPNRYAVNFIMKV